MKRLLLALLVTALAGAAAVPTAALAAWSAPHTITSSADVQFDFAVSGDGTAAAAWASGGYVRVAVRNTSGKWGSPVRVSSGRYGVSRPAVTVTGKDEVVVAWSQDSSPAGSNVVRGPVTIRGRARGRAGTWGSERKLGSTAHFIEADIDLASNAAGESIAVWRGLRQSGRHKVDAIQSSFRRPSTAFGGTQAAVESQDRGASGPSVAIDERGTAHVAWTGGTGPVVRLASRSRGATGFWGNPRALGSAPSSNPLIVVGSDRSATILWRAASIDTEGNGAQSGALQTRTRLPSGSLTAVEQLTTARAHSYWLTAGSSGQVSAAWPQGNADTPQAGTVHVRTRAATGGPFGPEQVIATGNVDDFHGGLAMLGDGTLLFAWSQGGRTRVAAQPPGGSFAAPEFDQAGAYPLIGAAGGDAVMTWNSISGNAVGLRAATRSD